MRDIPDSDHIDINKGPRTDRENLFLWQNAALQRAIRKDRRLATVSMAGLEDVPTIIRRPLPLLMRADIPFWTLYLSSLMNAVQT